MTPTSPQRLQETVPVGAAMERVLSRGQELELTPDAIGELRRSDDLFDAAAPGDPTASASASAGGVARRMARLRERLVADGYLFLPGYLDRQEVLGARRAVCAQLASQGVLDPRFPADTAAVDPGQSPAPLTVRPAALARRNGALQALLYAPRGRMMRFYQALFGEPVRHFDYTWLRVVRPGKGTTSHCDVVFMGRGTRDLYTSWTPLGDIDRRLGGLIVLEGSHRLADLKASYGQTDVDSTCENRFEGAWLDPQGNRNRPADAGGGITEDHVGLRRRLGGRWLTADFRAGDLLVFGMYLVHASLDNQTADRIRLSSDSRYQRASDPVDERWVGPQPPGHGPQSARGVIC